MKPDISVCCGNYAWFKQTIGKCLSLELNDKGEIYIA